MYSTSFALKGRQKHWPFVSLRRHSSQFCTTVVARYVQVRLCIMNRMSPSWKSTWCSNQVSCSLDGRWTLSERVTRKNRRHDLHVTINRLTIEWLPTQMNAQTSETLTLVDYNCLYFVLQCLCKHTVDWLMGSTTLITLESTKYSALSRFSRDGCILLYTFCILMHLIFSSQYYFYIPSTLMLEFLCCLIQYQITYSVYWLPGDEECFVSRKSSNTCDLSDTDSV